MFVEEPSGTICSYRCPRTTSGGVMLGDTASAEGKTTGARQRNLRLSPGLHRQLSTPAVAGCGAKSPPAK